MRSISLLLESKVISPSALASLFSKTTIEKTTSKVFDQAINVWNKKIIIITTIYMKNTLQVNITQYAKLTDIQL